MLTNTNILLQQEKKLHKARQERTFMHKRGVKEIVVLLCILVDMVTMFTAVDLYVTQKTWLSWTLTGALAFCLDVPPLLLGACIQDAKTPEKFKIMEIVALIAAFVLVFGGVFGLRMASMDQMYPVHTLSGLEGISGQSAPQTEAGHTAGQIIMALITALLPLATSICSFVLGLQSSPEDAYRHQLRLNQIELRQRINAMKVMYTELREDMSFDLNEYDEARYDIRLQTIRDQADILKSDSRKRLAEKLGRAEGVSELMEKPHQPRQETASGRTNRLNLSA